MRPHGIMFHHFHDARHRKGQGAISGDELAAMIEHLGRERILPAEEWMRRARADRLHDGDLCLTFDDALRCQFDVALPVLESFGLTAFWFVYSSVFEGVPERLEVYRHFRTTEFDTVDDFYAAFFTAIDACDAREECRRAVAGFDPERYLPEFPFYSRSDRIFRFIRDDVLGPARYVAIMDAMVDGVRYDRDELRRLLWMSDECLLHLAGEGHIVGLHSYSHPTRLGRLPVAGQRDEYQKNHAHLRRVLGSPPRAMSHPCDSYSPETLDLLDELGIVLGFRATMARPATSHLEYPREDHANVMARMKS